MKRKNKIYGIDELQKTKNISNSIYYFIRFHIYPGVKIVKTKGKNSILISLQNGEGWLLKSLENNLNIEQNVFLGGKKIINNECIYISGKSSESKISIKFQAHIMKCMYAYVNFLSFQTFSKNFTKFQKCHIYF